MARVTGRWIGAGRTSRDPERRSGSGRPVSYIAASVTIARTGSSDPTAEPAAIGTERPAYLMLAHLVSEELRSFLYDYALKAAQVGQLKPGDSQAPDSPSASGDPFMDALLELLLPRVETAAGLQLYPTYSYFRVYRNGAVLARHTDRESCEVSVTLSLGSEPAEPWPILIAANGIETSVAICPGDGLLYRGIELPHWRERFCGTGAVQVFLHYVDQSGPYREWRFDKRPDLTRSPVAARIVDKLASSATGK